MDNEQIDWTKLVPERKMHWELNPDSKCVIIKKPKFKNPLLKKYLLPRLKKPEYSVNLDKIGTFVWLNIDGKLTFRQIADKMRTEFGEMVEPVDDRLGQFINSLRRYEFISFINLEEVSSKNV